MKWVLSGCFGFILSSCGQVDFRLRDISSFSVPEDMLYSEKTECVGGVETIYLPELIGGGALLFNDSAQIQTGQVDLRIFPDGTYEALYREFDFHSEIFSESITGTYAGSADTQRIQFHGLGSARILKHRNRYKMALTFKRNYNSTLLLGQSLDLHVYRTASAPLRVAACQ